MTYYKYADRNVSQQVNYAEAAKGVVDILDQETAIREQKKQAIDDASAKLGEQIANAPFGQNQTLSTWTINAMEGAMAERLTQDQLLKSGRITLAEYTKRRQSLTESWGSMLGTLRNYNKIYDAHMDAFTSGKASKLQAWNMEQGDNFTNFNNTQAVIDPATGSVNIAKKKDDGTGVLKVSNDPKDIVNVVNLNKFLQTPIPKFNVVEAVEKYADATANSWQELINKGGIQTIDDIRKNPNFKKSKELWLNSLLQNEFEAGSIFVDWYQDETNQEIEITMDASKQGQNTLLLVPSPSGIPTPKLTDAQKKKVVEKMGEMYDVMLSRKITPMVERSGGRSKSGGGGSGSSSEWNKGIVDVNDTIEWVLPGGVNQDGEQRSGVVKKIKVINKADIMASSTRADKSSMVKLTVPAQVSGGVTIDKPIQSNVNVQSYFQAEDGGWYALGDIKKDVKRPGEKDSEGNPVSSVQSVNVIIPLKKEDYNALDAHYNDGTFVFSHWLNSQGARSTQNQPKFKGVPKGGF